MRGYLDKNTIDYRDARSERELSSLVGRHFAKDVAVVAEEEDRVVGDFVAFINNFQEHLAKKKREAEKQERRRAIRGVWNGGRSYDSEPDSDSEIPKLYCICNRPQFGEMIGCDDEKCEIEWFHVGCVNVSPSALKGGTWYCSDCLKRQAEERVARMLT